MTRVLLVTNDFPPTLGGIQSYLRDFVAALNPADTVVFASTQNKHAAAKFDAAQDYRVIRWPRKIMLPTPATTREMCRIIRREKIDTVWFGAAAPLGLMAKAAREAGATHIVATTHGHEVGWAMIPGARQLLGRIGAHCDVITYISEYTLKRIRGAFGEHPDYAALPSGVDTDAFRPLAHPGTEFRGENPQVVCVSRLVRRKGQDALIKVWPEVREHFPTAELSIVGDGPYAPGLKKLAQHTEGVTLTGRTSASRMRELIASADIFAMPARTRLGGIDVEGLGIVYLEAQASGVPVIAGDSGGAPETLTPDSGVVVNGRDLEELATAIITLLGDPQRRARMGRAGREHAVKVWSSQRMSEQLRRVLKV